MYSLPTNSTTIKKEKGIFLDGLRKIFLAKYNKDQIRTNKI